MLASGTIKMGDVVDAAGTIHMMENQLNTRAHFDDPNSYNCAAPNSAARHNEGWNVEFCDGHAKWLKDLVQRWQCAAALQYL